MSLIIDCGGCSLKVGYSTDTEPRIIPNWIARPKYDRQTNYIGTDISSITDMAGLYSILAFQKGYLVNWDVERQIFEHILGPSLLNANPQELNLTFTEPPLNFSSIQDTMDEIFFEEYGFKSLTRVTAANLTAYNYTHSTTGNSDPQCCCVIDSGFSFTHVMPFFEDKPIPDAFLRIDVGGKSLTNYLKDAISYRQLDVTEETYVINQVKEDVCYVSQDLYADLDICKKESTEAASAKIQSNITLNYILPDFAEHTHGYISDVKQKTATPLDQTLTLGNERFSVPELLFNPSDAGIDQMGLPEAINLSFMRTHPLMCEHLCKNIILTGGNVLFPGFEERLKLDLRSELPTIYELGTYKPPNPISYAWHGGKLITAAEPNSLPQHLSAVSAKQYFEFGHFAWKAHNQFQY